ncbi:PGPGW domain-containing protein [Thalassotalea sp. G2M2-11]|uniref:PGPGW domain-containing protein n=1 Tax=Thalassotalea sp. G2M2-11 TaxID=2787627 RepID=UPI0019D1FDBD|nr:PGPGW domain-containing protein [Thalassotalea sp. G2M2-11]
MKKLTLTVVGFACVAIGLIFILLPGPAVIFIPLGLAILSTQYPWAKNWLRKSQRMMRKSAVQMDSWWLKFKHRR